MPVFSSVGCVEKVQEKEADSGRSSGAAARAQQTPVEMQQLAEVARDLTGEEADLRTVQNNQSPKRRSPETAS